MNLKSKNVDKEKTLHLEKQLSSSKKEDKIIKWNSIKDIQFEIKDGNIIKSKLDSKNSFNYEEDDLHSSNSDWK